MSWFVVGICTKDEDLGSGFSRKGNKKPPVKAKPFFFHFLQTILSLGCLVGNEKYDEQTFRTL